MPYKSKKRCSHPGCVNLTDSRYCSMHTREANREYNKRRLENDPDFYKRYGRRWHEIRDLYIAKHPLCERCREAGRLVPAEEVHHILPLIEGGTNADDNLMSLCKSCHSSKTLSDSKQRGIIP